MIGRLTLTDRMRQNRDLAKGRTGQRDWWTDEACAVMNGRTTAWPTSVPQQTEEEQIKGFHSKAKQIS